MILNKTIEIKINSSNIKQYSVYYNDLRINEIKNIPIEYLTKFSNALIQVKCDKCCFEKTISYKLYKSYGYNNGEYYCRKCKLKINNIKKYGVENVFQIKDVKEKIKKTIKKNYGVEYISQSNDIKKKIKETSLNKYGKEHHLKNYDILQKQKNTNIKKWGVENISQLDEVKNKKVATSLNNYGVKYIFLDKKFKDNLIKNNLEKYGVKYIFQSNEIQKKIKETSLNKYGVDNPSKNNTIKEKIKKSNINTSHKKILESNKNIINIDSDNRVFNMYCNTCNKNFDIGYALFYKRRETNTCICTICNEIDKYQSGLEIQLQLFIKENYKGSIISNFKLNEKEINIYLPDLNLGFEFNGLYWHSELHKPKNYHLDKTKLCENNNIQLIHIWEDDWIYKQDIVKSMILNKLNLNKNRIYGRKCIIKEVADNNIIRNFLNENHIQGYTGSNIKLGLFFKNKLVSLMTFKRNSNGYELNRFCNLLNTTVIGSGSKLLNYFIKNYSTKIITFSNNSYSNGNIYLKLNFKKIYELKPDYHYVINNIRIHKFNLRNKNTDNIFRIYDAGKIKYIYESKI